MSIRRKSKKQTPVRRSASSGNKHFKPNNQLAMAVLSGIFFLGPIGLRAQSTAFPCSTSSPQYCAGSTNPIAKPADATVFPIKGMLAFAPGASGSDHTTMPTFVNNGKGTALTQNPNPWSIPFMPDHTYAAAAGKIIAPGTSPLPNYGYPEDVVYAWRNGNVIQVDFANPDHSQYGGVQLSPEPWDGTDIAQPLDKATYGVAGDFIALAVGDLDGAVDSNGETHDEVVVAFPVVDSEGTWKIEIYVLNYSNTTGAPAISENNTVHSQCGPACFATASSFAGNALNQGTILGAGNILSLAIGDFDGDGKNELAVAHVGDGNTILLDIMRYRSYGDPNTATLVRYLDTAQPANSGTDASSYIGSVALISGDFNNDGKDELALGYAQWVKNSTVPPGTYSKNPETLQCVDVDQTGLGLFQDLCDYGGYSVNYKNYITIYSSTLVPATATQISSSAATTLLNVENANAALSASLFISGATGTWAPLNGVWPILSIDGTQFTIPLDSSTFGTAPSSVTVSITAPFTAGGTVTIDPRIDKPGSQYKAPDLPATFDFRDFNSRPTMQLVPGLFTFDTTNPASFHERQILAVWNTPSPADWNTINNKDYTPIPYWKYDLVAADFTVSTDGNNTPTIGKFLSLPEDTYTSYKYGYPHQRFSLAASNFFGATDNADPKNPIAPTWQFSIGAWLDNGGYHIRFGDISTSDSSIKIDQDVTLPNGISSNYEGTGLFPVVAYDPDGSSYFLGAPVHFQTSNFLTPAYILQEPPKHMAWLNHSLANISRTSGTYSSVSTDNSTSSGTSATTTSGWDIANTVKVSAQGTLGDAAILGSEVSASDTLTLGYERAASKTKLNSLTSTLEFKADDAAPNDDYIQGNQANFDVWRYRIYGAGPSTDSNNPYKFYEMVVPGAPTTSHGGGTQTDWYHPSHENGNILSYPAPTGSQIIPTDVSPTPYQVDGQTPSGLTNGVMWNQDSYCFGSDAGSKGLTITGVTSNSTTVDTSNTMTEDNDLNVGYKTSAEGVFSASVDFDWNFGAKQSWSSSTTSTNSTSTSTGFLFKLAPGTASNGYDIAPVLYQAIGGAIKMAYSVNIPTSGASAPGCSGDAGDTWTNLYGTADPALLLPFRFDYITTTSDGDVFQLHPGHDREQLKSFFLENPTPNPIESTSSSTVYDKLTSIPTAGTQVQLAMPVYNYSVGLAAQNVGVQFSYIPVSDPVTDPDGALDDEYGCGTPTQNGWVCPDSYRTPLKNDDGSSVAILKLPTIPAWSSDPTQPNWTMARTTWTIPKTMAGKKYRIYVNLTYSGTEANPPQQPCGTAPCPPLCPPLTTNCGTSAPPTSNPDPLAPGQNNEGYGYVTVGEALTSFLARPYVRTTNDSLVAVGNRRISQGVVLGFRGQPLKLRVRAISDVPEARHHRVIVTDRTLLQRSPEVIGGKVLQGVGTQGSTAFFTWIPQKTGLNVLNATVQEFADDAGVGNNTAGLLALILRLPGDVNGDGVVDSADLAFLERENGKPVRESMCGYACDLNGDGFITSMDQDLLLSLCSREHCAAGVDSKEKPVSIEAVQEINRKEIASLRSLKASDWATALANEEPSEISVRSLYLGNLWRIGTTPEGPLKPEAPK